MFQRDSFAEFYEILLFLIFKNKKNFYQNARQK